MYIFGVHWVKSFAFQCPFISLPFQSTVYSARSLPYLKSISVRFICAAVVNPICRRQIAFENFCIHRTIAWSIWSQIFKVILYTVYVSIAQYSYVMYVHIKCSTKCLNYKTRFHHNLLSSPTNIMAYYAILICKVRVYNVHRHPLSRYILTSNYALGTIHMYTTCTNPVTHVHFTDYITKFYSCSRSINYQIQSHFIEYRNKT